MKLTVVASCVTPHISGVISEQAMVSQFQYRTSYQTKMCNLKKKSLAVYGTNPENMLCPSVLVEYIHAVIITPSKRRQVDCCHTWTNFPNWNI